MKNLNQYIIEKLRLNKDSKSPEDEINEDDYIAVVAFQDKQDIKISTFNTKSDALSFINNFKDEKFLDGYLVPNKQGLLWKVMYLAQNRDMTKLSKLIKDKRIKEF